MFANQTDLKRAVEIHLDSHNEVPTPFLSTVDNRAHAVTWISNFHDNTGIMGFLHELDTAKLGPVFRVLDLMSELGVRPKADQTTYWNEYLVLGEIPRESILPIQPRPTTHRLFETQLAMERKPVPIDLPRSIKAVEIENQQLLAPMFALMGTGSRRDLGNQEEAESDSKEMDDEEFQEEVAKCLHQRNWYMVGDHVLKKA